ncbi:hypothetical protein V1478_011224 [Vespula squamosa]|uniref:Uncharacterized protein n=1 Tax=Vespula squamosa TaxID=30214 RepID=A0ABD2AGI2_VESSQ
MYIQVEVMKSNLLFIFLWLYTPYIINVHKSEYTKLIFKQQYNRLNIIKTVKNLKSFYFKISILENFNLGIYILLTL